MGKSVIAVIAGLVAGIVVIMIIQAFGHQLYPVPVDLDTSDKEAMAEYIATAPEGALWMVILSYALGAFLAGLVAKSLARSGSVFTVFITGGILMVFGIVNLVMISHPTWFAITSLLVYIPFAWLGGRLVKKKQAGLDA